MAESKHTPGPWRTRRTKSGRRVTINGLGWFNFAKVVVRMDDTDHDNDEGLANASLIVAAPELLEACRRALSYIERDEAAHGREFGEGNVIRAAIAKAEAV